MADRPAVREVAQGRKAKVVREGALQRKAARVYTLKSHIYRVLKQIHPELSISADTSSALNRILSELIREVAAEAMNLALSNHQATIGSREIQSAIRLILSREMSKHSVSEGSKAVDKINAYSSAGRNKAISRSAVAGLTFPIPYVENHLRDHVGGMRVGAEAPVYLCAVLEYLCALLLEEGGKVTKEHKRLKVTDRHMKLAITNDVELVALYGRFLLAGGVPPNIERAVLAHRPIKGGKVGEGQ